MQVVCGTAVQVLEYNGFHTIFHILYITYSVEPVLEDHSIGHKMRSHKTGGLW